jgi:hypothetical protein
MKRLVSINARDNDQDFPATFQKSFFSSKILLSFLKHILTINACFAKDSRVTMTNTVCQGTSGASTSGGFLF